MEHEEGIELNERKKKKVEHGEKCHQNCNYCEAYFVWWYIHSVFIHISFIAAVTYFLSTWTEKRNTQHTAAVLQLEVWFLQSTSTAPHHAVDSCYYDYHTLHIVNIKKKIKSFWKVNMSNLWAFTFNILLNQIPDAASLKHTHIYSYSSKVKNINNSILWMSGESLIYFIVRALLHCMVGCHVQLWPSHKAINYYESLPAIPKWFT